MEITPNGVVGLHALSRVGLEADRETVLVQILPLVLMEMTALA